MLASPSVTGPGPWGPPSALYLGEIPLAREFRPVVWKYVAKSSYVHNRSWAVDNDGRQLAREGEAVPQAFLQAEISWAVETRKV